MTLRPGVLFSAAGAGGVTPPADPPAADPPAAHMIPKDRLDEALRQAREAATRADAAEARAQALEDEKKSDLEKAQQEAARNKKIADDATAAVAQMKRDNAVRAAATSAGAISPDAIVALVNMRNVEIDPEKPETITKAIETMRGTKEAPGPDAGLFGSGTPGTPATTFGVPSGGSPTPPAPTADANADPKLALGQGLLAAMGRGNPPQA